MQDLYLRNIKKGFATNSSSYHSTITRYIDIPESIWVEFKEQQNPEFINDYNGGYTKGVILVDDEEKVWRTYDEMHQAALERIEVEDIGLRNGKSWIRIIFETQEEDY